MALKMLVLELALRMALWEVLPACKQSHFREANDINAANTSGQEMLYVWPSILQELPENKTTVRISIDAFFLVRNSALQIQLFSQV